MLTLIEALVPAVTEAAGWVVMAIFEAAPAMLCNEKVAGVATLGLLATTENVPAVVLAVKVVAVASPLALVVAIQVYPFGLDVQPDAKAPLAPLAGAVKVTATLGTGLPNWSMTWTSRAVVKAVLTVAAWELPCTTLAVSRVVLAVTLKVPDP